MKIAELLESNKKFSNGIDKETLKELAEKGQQPVAAIVSCSDSRVPVEVIFNQLKPGRLFVIRVAGNIVADAGVKGSIEYAVVHLKVPYLIILAHTDCGAIKARLDGTEKGEIGRLVRNMTLVNRDLYKAIVENMERQVKRAMELDCVKAALDGNKLEVYGMLYDLGTGQVKTLSKNGAPFI